MQVTVKHLDPQNPFVLYNRYPSQFFHQPAYIALSLETGELWADWDKEIGPAVPGDVYHRRTLRFRIPVLVAEAANALLDDIAPLAQQVLDESTVEHDCWGNIIGRLEESSHAAFEELRAYLAGYPFVEGEIVEDWPEPELDEAVDAGLTAESTDEDLERIASLILDSYRADYHAAIIIPTLEEDLVYWREQLRNAAERKRTQDALISRAEIARLAGVQPPTVNAWARRHTDFPRRVATGMYLRSEVEAWLRRTGRSAE